MSNWQCSNCFKDYSFEEFRDLPSTKAVESDTDPKLQHGFTAVCVCGKAFGRDKWQLKTEAKGYLISTIHLELATARTLSEATIGWI